MTFMPLEKYKYFYLNASKDNVSIIMMLEQSYATLQ